MITEIKKIVIFSFIFILLECTILSSTEAPLETDDSSTTTTTTTSTSKTTTTSPSPKQHCEKAGLTCYDCHTLQFCKNVNDKDPVFTTTCSAQTGKQYCNSVNNICVDQNTCNGSDVTIEKCSQAGKRPDPLDCTQYVQCIETNPGEFEGYVVRCPDGLRYSITSQTCIANAPCYLLRTYCNLKPNKLIQYPPYPSIYTMCPSNPNIELSYELCNGEYQFDESVAQCQPVCTQPGQIPCNENCHSYYVCSKTSTGKYVMALNTCPGPFVYNASTQLCDPNAKCKTQSYKSKRAIDMDFYQILFE